MGTRPEEVAVSYCSPGEITTVVAPQNRYKEGGERHETMSHLWTLWQVKLGLLRLSNRPCDMCKVSCGGDTLVLCEMPREQGVMPWRDQVSQEAGVEPAEHLLHLQNIYCRTLSILPVVSCRMSSM